MSKASKDKRIGYGRPPEHTKFKPGQSGNPKGRPKGSKSLESLIQRELEKDAQVRTEEGVKTYKRRDLIAKQIVRGATAGERKHLDNVIRLDAAWQEKQAEVEKANALVPAHQWLDDAEAPLRLPLHIYEGYMEALRAIAIISRQTYGDKVKFFSKGFPASICYAVNVAFNEALLAYEESDESKQPGAWAFPYDAFEKANLKIDRQKIKEALRPQKTRPPGTLPDAAPSPVDGEGARTFLWKDGNHRIELPLPRDAASHGDEA